MRPPQPGCCRSSMNRASKYSARRRRSRPAAGTALAYEISHASNNSAIAVNRLLKAGARVSWTPTGGIVARAREDLEPRLREWSKALGIDVKGLSFLPASQRYLRAPRIALYQPWLPNMDEGWTRWLLEQYEFPYAGIRAPEIQAGKLRERFDAVLIADQSNDALLKGVDNAWT